MTLELDTNACPIMALDLGTKMGFATRIGHQVYSGTADFSNSRREGVGMRYVKFRLWLNQNIGRYRTEVWYEEVLGHKGTAAAHVYGGFLATLMTWCEERHLLYSGVPATTIKKHIAGKGSAGKKDIMNAVADRGFPAADDNEADALALLFLVEARRGEARS